MIITQKIELVVSTEDAIMLDSQSRICRKMYNKLLEISINALKNNINLLSSYQLEEILVKEKQKEPFYYSVHSSPLKNIIKRICKAFSNYDSSKKNFPKFKSNNSKWFNLFYDFCNGGIKITNRTCNITLGVRKSKSKDVRLKIVAKLKNKIKNNKKIYSYRITKNFNKYYLLITMQVEDKPLTRSLNNIICIDPNHKNFFIAVDNHKNTFEFQKIYILKYFDKQIDKLRSQLSRCLKESKKEMTKYGVSYIKPSLRYTKLNNAINKLYFKRQSQIKTALFTIANYISSRYDVIAIGNYFPKSEDISFSNMRRAMLNESVIGKFRTILEFVCRKKGKKFISVDENGTTARCFNCHYFSIKSPDVRLYTCPRCGKIYNRDINSAINIGIKSNLLSGSDYLSIDLSRPRYRLYYSLHKQAICQYD